MRKILLNIFCSILALTLLSCNIHGNNKNIEQAMYAAKGGPYFPVVRIVDGDTFWVDNGTEKGLKVRLIGVDAPESRKVFNKEAEYFGKEAKDYLANLIAGRKVSLVSDVGHLDRYGRTLSYVYLPDGTFVNAELIKNGFAHTMTVPPNVAYAKLFVELQAEARRKGRGLWHKK